MPHEVSHSDVLLPILSKLWPVGGNLIGVIDQSLSIKTKAVHHLYHVLSYLVHQRGHGDGGEALGAAEHIGQGVTRVLGL